MKPTLASTQTRDLGTNPIFWMFFSAAIFWLTLLAVLLT